MSNMTQEQFDKIREIAGNDFAQMHTEQAEAFGLNPLSIPLMAASLGYTIGLMEGASAFQGLTDEDLRVYEGLKNAWEYLLGTFTQEAE